MMRMKSSVHNIIPTVIDLTVQQNPQETELSVKQHHSVQKKAKMVREKKPTAKVRKTCTKTQNVGKQKPSVKRKRIPQEYVPVQQPNTDHGHNGLYQFDLTELISQKLKMLFEPPMAHSSSNLASYDPRHIWRRQPMMRFVAPNVAPAPRMTHFLPPPTRCGVPGCSQEAVPNAFHFSAGLPVMVGHTRQRFSIFRSVELMAESSCAPTH